MHKWFLCTNCFDIFYSNVEHVCNIIYVERKELTEFVSVGVLSTIFFNKLWNSHD
jgi:hypothetical protein